MNRRLSRILTIAVPLAVAAGGFLFLRVRPVEAVGHVATVGTVVDEVLGIGTLESSREVRVAFEAGGRVTTLAVDEGAPVTDGALLGEVDTSDPQADLGVAEASERVAAAAVNRARAELERGRAAAARATVERARADRLFVEGALPSAAREAAEEADTGATANVRALEAALLQAEQSREVSARTRRLRADQVADGRLHSPLTGLVVSRKVEVGQLVTPGTVAFTLAETDTMRVRAWVDESALGRLAVGQAARIVFRSEPDRAFPGRVERIGREVDRQTHELLVDVTALELPRNFAVGQRADVFIELARREGVTTLPRGLCDGDCLVAVDGRVRGRPVRLGLLGRDTVEVAEGLAPGEVVLGPRAASEGRRVVVRPAPTVQP